MPNIGIGEIAIVLVIALLIFGPKRLPELGRSLGRGLTEFRDGLQNVGNDLSDEVDEEDEDELDEEELDEEGTALPQPALESGEPVDATLPGEEPEVTEVTPVRAEDDAPPAGDTAPGGKD